MARPAYIIDGHGYHQLTGVTDFQTVLTDLATRLVGVGWVVISSGVGALTVESPLVDTVRFFRMTFVLASSTRLQCTVRDRTLRSTSQREMQLSGTVIIGLYYSARYLYIINETAATGEAIYASLVSLSPESETTHDRDTVFFGSRNNAGTLASNAVTSLELVTSGLTFTAQSATVRIYNPSCVLDLSGGVCCMHISGARRWNAIWIHSNGPIHGRLYNAIFMASSVAPIGVEYFVPIDEANTSKFKTINIPAGLGLIIALRVPS